MYDSQDSLSKIGYDVVSCIKPLLKRPINRIFGTTRVVEQE